MGNVKTVIETPKYSNKGILLLIVGIFLVGANLRAPLTSVGTLIGFIKDDLDMSNAAVGALTTLPLIVFALISPLAPKLAHRLGIEMTLLLSLIVLFIGIVIRPFFGVSTLLIGTILIGVGIAFGNVLMPGFIKLSYPQRIGIVMGIYTLSMNALSAVVSGISVPVARANPFGWKGAILISAVLVIIAIFIWLPRLRQPVPKLEQTEANQKPKKKMWGSFLAWQVTLFMGMQSLIFYTIITWVPEMMKVHGFTPEQGGWMLSIMQFSIIPLNFLMPILAARMKNQKLLSALTGSVLLIGSVGLLVGGQIIIPISTVMLGIATGSAFTLTMMFFTLRTSDGYEASDLSGMAQFVGYLLAAIGPVLFGFLLDLTNGWTVPILMLVISAIIGLISGIGAARDKVIFE